ncbi:glycerol-3-phosphate acyltransferase [Niallia sp. 01092]|uniref:glycerol-3-phosphate acyltransferase n=1 Tax=unclassified Niallia TaxID=2837522 RepID=UPI003FD619AD
MYLVVSYFIGNILFGYLVGKLLKGVDIRLEGSKNVGARNAGRLYGKKAFFLTFLGDALKGAVMIVIGKYFQFSNEILLIALFFVCLGHIKPLFFQFKGGKGVSTFIGGLIAFDFLSSIIIMISFFVFYLIYKSFTFTGFIALFLVCVSLLLRDGTVLCTVIALLTWLMIFLSHHISWKGFIPINKPV